MLPVEVGRAGYVPQTHTHTPLSGAAAAHTHAAQWGSCSTHTRALLSPGRRGPRKLRWARGAPGGASPAARECWRRCASWAGGGWVGGKGGGLGAWQGASAATRPNSTKVGRSHFTFNEKTSAPPSHTHKHTHTQAHRHTSTQTHKHTDPPCCARLKQLRHLQQVAPAVRQRKEESACAVQLSRSLWGVRQHPPQQARRPCHQPGFTGEQQLSQVGEAGGGGELAVGEREGLQHAAAGGDRGLGGRQRGEGAQGGGGCLKRRERACACVCGGGGVRREGREGGRGGNR